MGVPSVLPLPAAVRGQAGCPPRRPWGHLLLLCTALLFLGESGSGQKEGWAWCHLGHLVGRSVGWLVGVALGQDEAGVGSSQQMETEPWQPAGLAECDSGRAGVLTCLLPNSPGPRL